MPRLLRACTRLVAGLLTLSLLPASAWAQQKPQPPQKPSTPPKPARPKGPPKWSAEFHVGGVLAQTAGGGTPIDAFPVGRTFTSVNATSSPSRAVPSWLFGDGALLFNQVNAQFATAFNQHYPQIAPLDGMLTSASGVPQGGFGFGFRLSRQVTPRVTVDFTLDRSSGGIDMTSAARAAIDATRVSFIDGFNGLLALIPQTGGRASATLGEESESGGQTAIGGELTYLLMTRGKMHVHATGGVATVSIGSTELTVTLRGNYQFVAGGTIPINETDSLVIHFAGSGRSIAGVFGGGITYDVGQRHGFRADLRIFAGSSSVDTSIDATPIPVNTTSSDRFASKTNPAIQFSTLTGVPTSLSGDKITGLTTFSGGGFATRVLFTAGYFVRF